MASFQNGFEISASVAWPQSAAGEERREGRDESAEGGAVRLRDMVTPEGPNVKNYISYGDMSLCCYIL